jgi:glutamine amidotransferase
MSIRNRIVVVDYGMGNIHSIVKKIKRLGGDVFVSSNSDEILKSDKIILSGVGHYKSRIFLGSR